MWSSLVVWIFSNRSAILVFSSSDGVVVSGSVVLDSAFSGSAVLFPANLTSSNSPFLVQGLLVVSWSNDS